MGPRNLGPARRRKKLGQQPGFLLFAFRVRSTRSEVVAAKGVAYDGTMPIAEQGRTRSESRRENPSDGIPDTWLLLRGLARESEHWFDFPVRLSHALGAKVVTLDLPGSGALWQESAPLTVQATARHVAGRLRHVYGVPERPWGVLGLSFGGMVANALASAFPSRWSHVVLVNSSCGLSPSAERIRPEGALELLRITTLRDVTERERAVYRLVSSQSDKALERIVQATRELRHPITRRTVLRQLAAAARFSPSSNFHPLAHPLRQHTLVLCSDNDRLVNPKSSARLAAFLDAPLYTHPTAGHELTLDDPDWVVGRIKRWLDASTEGIRDRR